jgi:exosortase/archaeosortase family protein
MVGIDEACSGIRSFQATLMIALFFGEFYRLRWPQRWWLLAAGPTLALAFNLARTLTLVLVAAREGLPAMERWHDPLGVAVLVGCFFCLWGVAVWLARGAKLRAIEKEHRTSSIEHPTSKGQTPDAGGRESEVGGQWSVVGGPTPVKSALVTSPGSVSGFRNFSVSVLAVSLMLWAVVVEVSTEAWFRSHEARGSRTMDWTAQWPMHSPTLHTNIIAENSLRILQCDQNSSASWTGDDGVIWQAFYLRWLPADSFYGRTKTALSKAHNPAICLTGSGMKLEAQLDPVSLPVRPGFSLVFDRYIFAADERELYVFFSQTEDMAVGGQASLRSSHLARLRAALAGSRNYGQSNFEVALVGPETPASALRIFSARLPELIEIQPSGP